MDDDAWFIPGPSLNIGDGHVLRIRPPRDWVRVQIDIPRTPPSMNTNEIRSNWRGFQKQKKSWQGEIATELMIRKMRSHGPYQRAAVGAFLRFAAAAARRDKTNYSSLLDKALGDALVEMGVIADDDARHYVFGGVEFEDERGPDRTRVVIFLQPEEAK